MPPDDVCAGCAITEAEALQAYGVGLAASDACGGQMLCKSCFETNDPDNFADAFGSGLAEGEDPFGDQ